MTPTYDPALWTRIAGRSHIPARLLWAVWAQLPRLGEHPAYWREPDRSALDLALSVEGLCSTLKPWEHLDDLTAYGESGLCFYGDRRWLRAIARLRDHDLATYNPWLGRWYGLEPQTVEAP